MDFDDFIGWSIILILITAFVLGGWAIWSECHDPHIQLNKTEWHCSHSHTIYQTIMTGKTTVIVPEEICDTYRMNGYE